MNKRFCDLCGTEIEGDEPFENTLFIRLERDADKYDITDCCDECMGEFRMKFARYIKEKKRKAK